jgi:hypothetical protein
LAGSLSNVFGLCSKRRKHRPKLLVEISPSWLNAVKSKPLGSRLNRVRFLRELDMVLSNTSTLLVINEDIYVELLEVMELYCELLLARFGLLDQK